MSKSEDRQVKRVDCIHVKWYVVKSLGGRKFPFCNARNNKGSEKGDYSVPVPPHGELCPHAAGEECRWYKPVRVNFPSPDLNRNEL